MVSGEGGMERCMEAYERNETGEKVYISEQKGGK